MTKTNTKTIEVKKTYIEPCKPWLMHRLTFPAVNLGVFGPEDEDRHLLECQEVYDEFNADRNSDASRNGLWQCLKAHFRFDYMGASEYELNKPVEAFKNFLDCNDYAFLPLEVACCDVVKEYYVETFYVFGPRSTIHTQVYAVLKSLWFRISPTGRGHVADFRCKSRNGIGEENTMPFHRQGFRASATFARDGYVETPSSQIGTFDLDNCAFVFWHWFLGGSVYRMLCGGNAVLCRKHHVDITHDIGAYATIEGCQKLVLETMP